jgi:hypothetical protein
MYTHTHVYIYVYVYVSTKIKATYRHFNHALPPPSLPARREAVPLYLNDKYTYIFVCICTYEYVRM